MTDCNTGREKLDVVLSHMHGTELHRTRLLPLFIVYITIGLRRFYLRKASIFPHP